MQTDFKRMLANKLLLCSHLEKEAIKIQYVTSPMFDLYEYQITWFLPQYGHVTTISTQVLVQNSFAR